MSKETLIQVAKAAFAAASKSDADVDAKMAALDQELDSADETVVREVFKTRDVPTAEELTSVGLSAFHAVKRLIELFGRLR